MVVRGPSGMMSAFVVVACMTVTVEPVILLLSRKVTSPANSLEVSAHH